MHIPTVTDTMEHMHRHNHIATVLLELFDQSNLVQFQSGRSVSDFQPHPSPIPVLKDLRPAPRTCINISVHQKECRAAPRPTRKRSVFPCRPICSPSFELELISVSTWHALSRSTERKLVSTSSSPSRGATAFIFTFAAGKMTVESHSRIAAALCCALDRLSLHSRNALLQGLDASSA
jgi:hypothetical protein